MNTVGGALLLRLALRRDRVICTVWTLVLLVTCVASAAATPTLYANEAEQVAAARALNASPAVVALYGPILDVHSIGELSMTKMTVLYAVFVAMLAAILVRRHTRVAEESGQAELLGGTAIGRDAPMFAAVVEASIVSLVVGLLCGLGNFFSGLPLSGSLLFGASWAGIGLIGTGLTAVAAQLSASARTVGALTAGGLGVLFALRVVGDTTSAGWLSWLSPFGWGTQLRAWHEPRVWMLLLYLVLALALVKFATALRARRDLGSGIFPERPGPANGPVWLANPFALSWRIHRSTVFTWSAATAAFGLLFGAIAPGIGSLLESSGARDAIRRMGGEGAIQDAMLAAELSVAAIVITCFALTVVGHSGSDEVAGRTEQVLATGIPRRSSWLAALMVCLLGTAWLLLITGVAAAIGFGGKFATLPWSGLGQLPAVWLVCALGLMVLGFSGRRTWLAWALLGAFLVLGLIGDLLKFPEWVTGLSPYDRAPKLPGGPIDWTSQGILLGLAAVAMAVGWWLYDRRDLG